MHPAVAFSVLHGATPTVWQLPWPTLHGSSWHDEGWQRIGETTAPTAYLAGLADTIDARALALIVTGRTADTLEELVIVIACEHSAPTPTAVHIHRDGTIHNTDPADAPLVTQALRSAFTSTRFN